MSNRDNLNAASRAYEQLLTNQQSLTLATVNGDGSPLVSYSPFVVGEDKQFYIFVSQLAGHTANLQQRGQASLMLIEDEASAAQIFARQRLIFQCEVKLVARSSAEWQQVMTQYQERFGKMADLLVSLPDFQLFKLRPVSGRLVLGFGQAYELGGERLDTFVHQGRG